MNKTLMLIRGLGPMDLKSVARDSMLMLISVGCLILALVIRLAAPFLTQFMQDVYGLDIEPIYPLLMSLVVLMAPAMAGMVIGLLLLDERDEQTLTALLVTPIPLSVYMLYRLGLPILLSLVITPLAVVIAGLVTIPLGELLLVTILSSISGATTALLLVSLAANKVSGIAVIKMIQGVQALPLAAFFVAPPLQWIAGIVPSYWPLVVYWRMAGGEPYVGYYVVGLAINIAILAGLTRYYEGNLRR